MDSSHSPQQTFHNLCVIAAVDGVIHDEEQRLLLEFAEAMGLEEAEAETMIQAKGPRNFIIPEDQNDREMEIRFLAMVATADGKVDPAEKDMLVKMAIIMEIPQIFLEHALEFHLEKTKERLQNRDILHNLYLMARADDELSEDELNLLLDVAYNLGLTQNDISLVLDHKLPDTFHIPEDDNEQWYSLKNLVFMMIIDGEITEEEYEVCLKYAELIGRGEEEIESILDEYQEMANVGEEDAHKPSPANLDAILDTFATLRTIETPTDQLVDLFEQVLEFEEIPDEFDPDPVKNRACLELMWLMFVWAPSLTEEASEKIPLYLDLAMAKGNWKDMRDYLLGLENRFGNGPIPFQEWDEDDLVNELVEG